MPDLGASTPEGGGERTFVTRQPILDERNQVFAYELLCRDAGGGKLAFLSISRDVLLSDVVTRLYPGARWIRVDGPGTALQPFAGFAKVDVAAEEPGDLSATIAHVRSHGIRPIAAHVETHDAFDVARAAGCLLFQGYYFCQPRTFAVKAISTRPLAQVALVAALNKPHVTLGAIEELLKRGLSLRVLRCVNSAGFGLRREVHSIREAPLLLGLHQVRKWASVWALAGVNGGSPELVSLTVLRARCCELLGARLNLPDGGPEYFLLGLCSLLDVVADRPMEEAVKELPLTQDTRDALLGRQNAALHVLDAVMLHEGGDWDAATKAAARVGLGADDLPEAYHQALSWARQVTAAAAA